MSSSPRCTTRRPWQLVDPLLGVSSDLGLRNWGFALAAYAPPGAARLEFPGDGGQRYLMVSREAVILNYTASAAWQYRERFGVGVSLQWIHVPRLDYELVIDANQFPGDVNPVSSELDMLASVSGSDPFTFNAILGAWYRPLPFLEFGASGQVIPTRSRPRAGCPSTPSPRRSSTRWSCAAMGSRRTTSASPSLCRSRRGSASVTCI